ncbi:MAG: hypothetical protein F6J86_20395 [Symploca sp. SIO1B1]|nr:hypothetical protein [Symploca sp. SIO1B1]
MWGCEKLRELRELRKLGELRKLRKLGELRELRKLRKLGELRKLRKLRKLGDKRELIAIGYKAQEIPPKISFTRWEVAVSMKKFFTTMHESPSQDLRILSYMTLNVGIIHELSLHLALVRKSYLSPRLPVSVSPRLFSHSL